MSTEEDRTCALLARAALFPKRMHRDVADASHFPALLQLDLLRDRYLSSDSVSSVFPRHVVVVRNLADGGIQWNGEPDFDNPESTQFAVIPNHLTVSCTSHCNASVKGRAYRKTNTEGEEQIVLCSGRILHKDSKDPKYKGVAKDLPPKSFQAVEEVLAHQLVQVRRTAATTDKAQVEVEAARAAECYFSQHSYDKQQKIVKKGSRLQTGYSYLPSFLQNWSMNKCLTAVAKEYLMEQQSVSQQDALKAVQEALKHQ